MRSGIVVVGCFFSLILSEKSCLARDKCDENGLCWNDKDGVRQICGLDSEHCNAHQDAKSGIYHFGGTAQAYKPVETQEDSLKICDASRYAKSGRKVAAWPLWRWKQSSAPPVLKLTLQIWVCDSTTSSNDNKNCCCQSLSNLQNDEENTAAATVMVEAWQARPDGTYSSIRSGHEDSDCRSSATVDPATSTVSFETVAPGSVGSLGGLAPVSFLDWMPYKPPALHLLISAPEIMHTPILFDLPLLIQPKTLQQREFSLGSYWRGPSAVQDMVTRDADIASPPVKIFSWTPNPTKNEIDISLDVLLAPTADNGGMSPAQNATDMFCGSLPVGFPASFFMAPISTCSPSLLDFFAL